MLTNILLLIIGFVVLTWSTHRLIDGAVQLSLQLNISTLVIGLILVSFFTSAPELVVSVMAAFDGYTSLAVANVFGSNIANIALALGLALTLTPIAIEKINLTRDLPLLLIGTLLLGSIIYNDYLNRTGGLLLLLGFIVFMHIIFVHESKRRNSIDLSKEVDTNQTLNLQQSLTRFIGGVILLLISARVIVYAAVSLAEQLGISEVIIGLTIIAIGTSLPEIASCVVSALRKESRLAVGTIIGSNVFNSLLVTGSAGLINPAPLAHALFARDFIVMAGITFLLFFSCLFFYRRGTLPRTLGILFCLIYFAYLVFLSL